MNPVESLFVAIVVFAAVLATLCAVAQLLWWLALIAVFLWGSVWYLTHPPVLW